LNPPKDEFIYGVADRHHFRLIMLILTGAIARLARSGCLPPVHYRYMQEIFAEAVMLSESPDRMTWGEPGGRFMTTIHTDGTRLSREIRSRVCDGNNIRALIADQLGVDLNRITDQTHFARDLGVGWLNRLELVIFVEDWTGLELDDDDVERIDVVGDLISRQSLSLRLTSRPASCWG
jgi:acyl carrier protein